MRRKEPRDPKFSTGSTKARVSNSSAGSQRITGGSDSCGEGTVPRSGMVKVPPSVTSVSTSSTGSPSGAVKVMVRRTSMPGATADVAPPGGIARPTTPPPEAVPPPPHAPGHCGASTRKREVAGGRMRTWRERESTLRRVSDSARDSPAS